MNEKLDLLLSTLTNYSPTDRQGLVDDYADFRNDYLQDQEDLQKQ